MQSHLILLGFLDGLVVKSLSANAGDIRAEIQSLGQKGPLEEGLATHCSILAWREEPGGYSPRGLKELDKTESN